jgi:septin family protein
MPHIPVYRTHLQDLIETTAQIHYEAFRFVLSVLKRRPFRV